MPIGFQTGASPAKTYILPPAAAPEISSAGWGNGASFDHFPWAEATAVANIIPTITVAKWRRADLDNLGIVLSSLKLAQFSLAILLQRCFAARGVATRSPSAQTESALKW